MLQTIQTWKQPHIFDLHFFIFDFNSLNLSPILHLLLFPQFSLFELFCLFLLLHLNHPFDFPSLLFTQISLLFSFSGFLFQLEIHFCLLPFYFLILLFPFQQLFLELLDLTLQTMNFLFLLLIVLLQRLHSITIWRLTRLIEFDLFLQTIEVLFKRHFILLNIKTIHLLLNHQ